jgi:hypothetical protein
MHALKIVGQSVTLLIIDEIGVSFSFLQIYPSTNFALFLSSQQVLKSANSIFWTF